MSETGGVTAAVGVLTREKMQGYMAFFVLLQQNVFGSLLGTVAAYAIVSLSTKGN